MLTTLLNAQTTDFGIETWRWDCGSNFVTIDFTTNVNATLATDPANYLFNPPVTINAINHSSPSHVVVLDVSTLSTTVTNVLTVTNVTSIAGEPLDPQYSQAFLYCHHGDDDGNGNGDDDGDDGDGDDDDGNGDDGAPCEVLCPDGLFTVDVDCPALMPNLTQYVTLSGNCDPDLYTMTQSIPVGTPLSNGVHWVTVNVTGPGGFDEDCRFEVIVDCPEEPPPGGPCENVLSAIPVNTGWDHNSNTTYNVGNGDAFWTVIDDPDSGTTEPRPAFVINQHPAWQPAMPDSQWISAYAGSANNLNGAYDLEFIFCLVEGWSNAVVDIALRVDDRAEVYLNGTLIGQTPPLFSFNSLTPTMIFENDQTLFQTGANSLMVRMINSHGVAMGLNLVGEIRGDGLSLEDPLCCDAGSSISGQKFYDANQNGVFDPNETVLAGWTIEATDGTNVWTSVTDVNGYYYFMGLPPGTYTITEVQQPNYIQTAPVGNSHTVTVGLAQVVSGLDFGNYREIQEPNSPPRVECPDDLIIDCVNGGTNVTLTANFIDTDGDPLSYSWFINNSFYTSGGIPAGGPPTTGSSTITPFLTVGTNTITVTVNDGSAEDACTFTVVLVPCPQEPGGPCDNVLSAIPVNTGWDHNSNTTYNIGAVDAFWTVIDDPDPGTTEPRPAFVINQHPAWQPAMPDSQWISAYGNTLNNLNGAYDLEFIFCLVEGWSNAVVDIALRVDDRAEVYLNGTLIGQTPALFSFSLPTPTTILENNQSLFQTGANSLMVRMINSHGVAMGLNLAGEVRADGLTLEDPLCCEPGSSISGQKFYDANQNGIFDPNETVLAGWTIEATDGTNTWTSVTDVNGYYYFMGLPPGTYVITEVQQPNYTQTAPASGSYVVTVGLAQGVSGLDFGNYRIIKEPNQPPIVLCPEDMIIDCVDGGTNVTLTANFSDADGDPLTYSWFINGSLYTSGGIPAGGPPTTGSSTITPFLTVGTNTITVTVNDGSADDSCTFTVVINDVIPPILHCRDQGIIVLPVNSDCEAELPAMPYVITPGCTPLGDLVVTQTPPVGTLLGPGIHWIILEVYDPATGQSLFCRFQVQVVDRLPPRVQCPELEPVEDCEAEIPDLTSSLIIHSNCDPVADLTIVQSPAPGTVVGPGSHTITITVTDSSGNVAQCTTVFTVMGNEFAVPINGLINTGVNSGGFLLPIHAIDPHYELTLSADPGAPGPAAYVVDPRPPNWVANTATSQWIAPRSTLAIYPPGQYVYEIEFTLPTIFGSAEISGTWATDNSAEIYLNGVATGITKPANGFLSLTPFTITSGFVPGVNTLEFRVQVLHRHTGLHVSDLRGTVWTCEEPCTPPSVLLFPLGQTVVWGGTATFSAFTSGTPPFIYQWFFNGAPLPGETNSTLTVSSATHANAGLYHVVVSNPCGEVSSRRARLRVRRPWVVVIDNWVIGRPFEPPIDPPEPPDEPEPRPIMGDLGTLLHPLPLGPDPLDWYESTDVAAQFGRTTEFGIPGPDGVPVDVMQFTYGFPGTGYALMYDPAELPQQTLVMDVFVAEETGTLPLLSFDSDEGDDAVVYLQAGEGESPADIPVVMIPVGTWSRVIISLDADQGSLHGHVLLREGSTLLFDSYGTLPPGNGMIRFLPSGADDHGVLYVHSLAWFSKVLTDLEIAALGAPSPRGIPVEDPVWNRSRAGVTTATYSGGLSLRWESSDFTIQQSTNLVDWESITLEPVLVTDSEDEVEYRIDLPTGDHSPMFYRGISGMQNK